MSLTGTKCDIIALLLASHDVRWISVTTVDPNTLNRSHEIYVPVQLVLPEKQSSDQRPSSPYDYYMQIMKTPKTSHVPPIYITPGELPKLEKRKPGEKCSKSLSHIDDLTYLQGVWPESAPDIERYQKMLRRMRAHQ